MKLKSQRSIPSSISPVRWLVLLKIVMEKLQKEMHPNLFTWNIKPCIRTSPLTFLKRGVIIYLHIHVIQMMRARKINCAHLRIIYKKIVPHWLSNTLTI